MGRASHHCSHPWALPSHWLRSGFNSDFRNIPLCTKHHHPAAAPEDPRKDRGQRLGPAEERADEFRRGLLTAGPSLSPQLSSICRAAVHAGVVRNHGGYVDVMPVDRRKAYTASFQNGIFSERYTYNHICNLSILLCLLLRAAHFCVGLRLVAERRFLCWWQ